MNSISNKHFGHLRFALSKKKLYDFQLSDMDIQYEDINDSLLIDFNPTILKLSNKITWSDAIIGESLVINNFGLTALDNGRIPFDNVNGYESTLQYQPELSTTLELFKVDGYTRDINYIINDETTHLDLQGGFFQGFYKLEGYDYQVLPERYEKGWTISVDLKQGSTDYQLNTLNNYASINGYDTDGFFFYTGTRAENKYWNAFEPTDLSYTGITESSYSGVTNQDFIIPLIPPRVVIKKMENQFLIYGRSNGNKTCTSDPTYGFGSHVAQNIIKDDAGDVVLYYSGNTKFDNVEQINSFLKYGRSNGKPRMGDDTDHIDYVDVDGNTYDYGTAIAQNDVSQENLLLELNPNDGLDDNALGFRVTSDGKIGYRRIISKNSCLETPTNIYRENDDFYVIEDYTESLITNNVWSNITLRWSTELPLKCDTDDARVGKLDVYVDGFLKHTFTDFVEVINRAMDEDKDKQLGVPYNISVGGGTQALLENMTFGGSDPLDYGLTLEECFAGTFIGGLKNFKMYQSPLSFCGIKNMLTNNP